METSQNPRANREYYFLAILSTESPPPAVPSRLIVQWKSSNCAAVKLLAPWLTHESATV